MIPIAAPDPVLAADGVGDFVDRHREVLVTKPLRILLIILLALVARALLLRLVRRLIRSTTSGDVPTVLRPLKERAVVNGLLEGTGLLSERRRQRAETIGSILGSIASVVIGMLALMLILAEFEFQLGPFIAGAGIVGVALGFGAQNLVKDFLSGISMILEDQYGVGDVVDLGEVIGTVEGIGLRTTRLRDDNGTVWYVRNGEITRVGNKTQGFAQVVLDLPVPYSAGLDRASGLLRDAAEELYADPDWADAMLEEPKLLGIERITEDGVVLRLTVKTEPAEQWRVARELRRRVSHRLVAEEGLRGVRSEVAVRGAAEPDVEVEPGPAAAAPVPSEGATGSAGPREGAPRPNPTEG